MKIEKVEAQKSKREKYFFNCHNSVESKKTTISKKNPSNLKCNKKMEEQDIKI